MCHSEERVLLCYFFGVGGGLYYVIEELHCDIIGGAAAYVSSAASVGMLLLTWVNGIPRY